MKPTRDQVRTDLFEIMQSMGDEWDDPKTITEDSSLFGDANWRSIELAYVARAIQQRYEQVLPFQEWLQDLEQQGRKGLTIGEFVDFIHSHLDENHSAPSLDNAAAPESLP